MKDIKMIVLVLLATGLLTACAGKSEKYLNEGYGVLASEQERLCAEACETSFRDFVPGVFLGECVSGDTIGFVCGRFYSNERTDTLYCVAIGTRYYADTASYGDNLIDTYVFTNEARKLTPLYLTAFYFLNDVKVQDLDKDGRDEIGMVRHWYIGGWFSYNIFDFDEGEWKMLCRPIMYYNNIERDEETAVIARPSERDGHIIVLEDGWTEGYEEIITEKKEIEIERMPIQHKFDTCFSIPGGKTIVLPVKLGQ